MEFITYEVRDRVAVISLDRPDTRNAQHPPLLHELDDCWTAAVADPDVRVILLRANGPHFSSGHDLSEASRALFHQDGAGTEPGAASLYRWEHTNYLGLSRKWRDAPKPSIAAVQGACIAGGLMLCWPCDLIVAADNARFSDPVVRMGIGGVEYHAHTWELGARKAKEWLFTAGWIDAREAERLGMVNRVVATDELDERSMQLATEIAQMDPFGLAMAKRAVNQTLDTQGQWVAQQAVFDMHQLGHANVKEIAGKSRLVGVDEIKSGLAGGASTASTAR